MRSYMNCQIYAIRSVNSDKIYIDATITHYLCRKLHVYKTMYQKYLDGKGKYHPSFEVVKEGNIYIELVKTAECENKNELKKIKNEVIRSNPNCVNSLA